jgi:NADH dehydrogenase
VSNVFIIGAGFAGIAAAKRFKGAGFDVFVVDKKQTSDFLPVLPDCLGRGINPRFLSYRTEDIARTCGFEYINEEVISIDIQAKKILTKSGVFKYDFAVIASGSETNFYNNETVKRYAFKLDDASDASAISEKIKKNKFDNYIIAGAGYTGVEVAVNLKVFLDKTKSAGRIIIVERSPSILGPLPGWMKQYVFDNLKKLNIDVFVESQIENAEEGKVCVSGNRIFKNSFLIWAAGVRTADFIQKLKAEKNPQGRIKTDEYLRLNENCFVAGDASYFSHKNIFLRMAVQFAIAEGDIAAQNIINAAKGRRLKKFKPADMGYIIPMANNKSCGVILGVNMKGFLPTVFHFMMCAYRSLGLENRTGIIRGLITGGEL